MKNKFEKIKDLLYDYIDYVLIILVVVIIGGIIGWRLEILFNDNETEAITSNIDSIEKDVDENSSKKEKEDSNANKEEKNDSEENKDNDEKSSSSKDDKSSKNDEEIAIEIPQGSLPSDTAQILLDNDLIDDVDKFIDRAEALKLETKLRSGEFTFNKGSDLDNIIKTLANIK
ncbi:hypothetical protein GOQ29_13205 [Clostridium sp. D2Q-14]|uniref:hypothetical protein n=1 Tax=Anaeromonas gelatinilytica TaxID=2683194 RepID=UPI00193B9E49|nr:hypothetical protein [Anaeromonas gelatinilytica]MBS4536576.1 hypothetical protein [Anaeromonas gelatinilytica]